MYSSVYYSNFMVTSTHWTLSIYIHLPIICNTYYINANCAKLLCCISSHMHSHVLNGNNSIICIYIYISCIVVNVMIFCILPERLHMRCDCFNWFSINWNWLNAIVQFQKSIIMYIPTERDTYDGSVAISASIKIFRRYCFANAYIFF